MTQTILLEVFIYPARFVLPYAFSLQLWNPEYSN